MKTIFSYFGLCLAFLFISGNISAQCGIMCMNSHKQESTTKKDASSTADTGKVVYTCPMHPEIKSDKPGICPKCEMNLEMQKNKSESSVYTCPMHPDVKSDKEGKCPQCGMFLKKTEKEKSKTYTCSMCGGDYKKAGKCKKCNMNLIEKK